MGELMQLTFHHKGAFQKAQYVGGTDTVVKRVDPDYFSYTVLMEFVKDDLQYTEIGGIYMRNGEKGGWKLVTNDADLSELVKGVNSGGNLDFYIDNVVDTAIEPLKQMQPHVIMRPRQNLVTGIYKWIVNIIYRL